MVPTTRRTVLRMAGIGTLATLAGCNSLGSSDESKPLRIGSIGIRNHHDEPHEVRVEVLADGERRYTGTTDIEAAEGDRAGSSVTRASILESLQRPVTVRGRLDAGDWHERDLSESHSDTPCVVVAVRISDPGDVDILTTTGYECKSTLTPADS